MTDQSPVTAREFFSGLKFPFLVSLTSGASVFAESLGFVIIQIFLIQADNQQRNIIVFNGILQIMSICKTILGLSISTLYSLLLIISLLRWNGN